MLQNKMNADYEWLKNPEVFQVNRENAHSDHFYFDNESEMEKWEDTGVESSISLRQSLNGTWKFAYTSKPSNRYVDFYKEEFDCSGFCDIQVPGHIQMQGYGKCQYINNMYPWDGIEYLRPPQVSDEYNPVGSYVKYFDVNEKLLDKRIFISFQGVETAMYVWLNGEFVGYAEDSFTPSEFELTPYIKANGNKLAVEVYKRSSASWLEDQDFFRFSGIFREVFLYAVPKVHIRDLKVVASLDDTYTYGVLSISADVICDKEMNGKYKISYEVLDGDKCILQGKKFDGQIIVPNVKKWSAEFPNLYDVVIKINDNSGNFIEGIKQRIGFRRFEMLNGVMCLNGKRIIFHGVNRHEFCCESGRVLDYEKMLYDIKCMKKNHINAVRTSHYPNQSVWYRLCDEFGIYVIDETNLESHGSWQKLGVCEPSWNVPGNLPEWQENVLDRAKSMYERDKNHASILMWSCGNESYAGNCILNMANYFREQDSERLVHYEGCFHNREYDMCSDMESRMYAKPDEIKEYLDSNPVKPYISCEYMHAMGNSCGGLLQYQELEHLYEKYQGGFIWDFVDQALQITDESGRKKMCYGGDFDDRATDYNFCGDGLLFADRSETPKMQEIRYLFQDVHMKLKENMVTVENHFLFNNLTGCVMKIRTENEDGIIEEILIDEIVTECGKSREIPISLAIPNVKEYTINAIILDSEKSEIAREQEILINRDYSESVDEGSVAGENSRTRPVVVEGDVNIGVKTNETLYLFSLSEGGIVSLNYKEREHIVRAPKITFWRALTDNDMGYKAGFDRAGWMTAGMFAKVDKIVKDSKDAFVEYHYMLPGISDGEAVISYQVKDDGSIDVKASFTGTKLLKEMPLFGVEFMMKGSYGNFEYYGMGPDECHLDRQEGAFLGRYQGTAYENVTKNLRPQECGNRTGVRKLTVTDSEGAGLLFTAINKPFEMSVLPYSSYELENALHYEELPNSDYTWVKIAATQMGVGGDDSWGAPVREQYLLDGSKEISVEVNIRPIE